MDPETRRQIHDAIVRLAEGDRSVFPFVFDALWPRILRFVERAMPGRAEAEDLAQQALLKLFARIAEFDTSRDGVAWAFGIVAYEIRTLRRQEQRRRESPHDAAAGRAADLSQSPEALAVLEDLTRALTAALGQLSTADREVLLADDTGEISAPSPSALRKRRQRALERLRTAWRRLHA